MATTPASAASAPYGGIPSRIRKAVSPRCMCTGTQGAVASADFNNTTPGANTEIYVSEIMVPFPIASTGAAIFNGSDDTDNKKIAIYDVSGNIIASTAVTTTGTADTYQRMAWALEFITSATTGTAIVGPIYLDPGTYYLAVDYAATTSRFQTFVVGNFGAGKITSAVYATAFISTSLTIAPPTTFTTILGPVISLY